MGFDTLFQPPKTPPRKKLNILPENEDKESLGRFPSYLHRPLPKGGNLWKTKEELSSNNLPTVCEEARCPNLLECWTKKTATFLALGKQCTRNCGFCDIDFSKTPLSLQEDEPLRLAETVKALGLNHVVITMVARDDLSDGGSGQIKEIQLKIRELNPTSTIEILTSDFQGEETSLQTVLSAKPEIFNHNVETVRSLTPRVRHKATYDRSLQVLKNASRFLLPTSFLKSGIMLGLGETKEEVKETLRDLKEAGCHIVTIGHYLQPNLNKLRVKAFISPQEFDEFAEYGRSIGIPYVYAGPFVRSSYNAASLFKSLKNG